MKKVMCASLCLFIGLSACGKKEEVVNITQAKDESMSINKINKYQENRENINGEKQEKFYAAQFINPFFADLNCENNDIVDPGEVEDHFSMIYFTVNQDRDKIITLEELKNFYFKTPAAAEFIFKQADTDKNGVLSHNEYRDAFVYALEVIDKNNNGDVTRQEMESYLDSQLENHQSQ